MGKHGTLPMVRFPGLTNGTTVINQNVGKPAPSVFRQKLLKIHLNFIGILVFREAQPQGEPFHVGIHNNPRHIKGSAQNTVGGLSSHSRQFDQLRHGGWHFSAVSFHQSPTASLDGFGLVSEKTGGSYIHFQLADGDGQKIFRRQIFLKQDFGNRIHLLVSTLGREDGTDEQLKRGSVLEGGFFQGIEWIQNIKNLVCPGSSTLFAFHNLLSSDGFVRKAFMTAP